MRGPVGRHAAESRHSRWTCAVTVQSHDAVPSTTDPGPRLELPGCRFDCHLSDVPHLAESESANEVVSGRRAVSAKEPHAAPEPDPVSDVGPASVGKEVVGPAASVAFA